MTTVFIYGKKSDKRLTKLIIERLCGRYDITCYDGERLSRHGSGYELVIIDGDRAGEITADVVIMKEKAVPENVVIHAAAVIANSDVEQQLTALSGCCVISCGSGKTDTISFSSNTFDSTVVALGRSFTALSGRIVQPLEIPTDADGGYSALALTALRLLLDDYNSDIGSLY